MFAVSQRDRKRVGAVGKRRSTRFNGMRLAIRLAEQAK